MKHNVYTDKFTRPTSYEVFIITACPNPSAMGVHSMKQKVSLTALVEKIRNETVTLSHVSLPNRHIRTSMVFK